MNDNETIKESETMNDNETIKESETMNDKEIMVWKKEKGRMLKHELSHTFKQAFGIIADVTPKLSLDDMTAELRHFRNHLINAQLCEEVSIPLNEFGDDFYWCLNDETKKYDLMIQADSGRKPVIQCKIYYKQQAHSKLPALADKIRETVTRHKKWTSNQEK
jgi:hypothetical protein